MPEQQFHYSVWVEYKAKPTNRDKQKKYGQWHSLDFAAPLQEGQLVEIADHEGRIYDLRLFPIIYGPKEDSRCPTPEGNSCRVNLGKITRDTYEEMEGKLQKLERWRYEKK